MFFQCFLKDYLDIFTLMSLSLSMVGYLFMLIKILRVSLSRYGGWTHNTPRMVLELEFSLRINRKFITSELLIGEWLVDLK